MSIVAKGFGRVLIKLQLTPNFVFAYVNLLVFFFITTAKKIMVVAILGAITIVAILFWGASWPVMPLKD